VKKFKKFSFCVFLILFAFAFAQCKPDSKQPNLPELAILSLIATPWTQVTPASQGSITIHGKTFNYTAECSGQAATGAQNTTFSYFIRPGDPKKLIINYMGGGACWNQGNCFGPNTGTYFNAMSTLTPLAMKFAFSGGILDTTNPNNPLSGYTVVFIPYCTGDLHWGSSDTAYNPTTNSFNGDTAVGGTIHHRGFDNSLAVINDLMTNYPSPTKVLITGQSAGGYGAIFNAPYIIEKLGGYGSTTDYVVISDASAGVTPTGFNNSVDTIWGLTAGHSLAGGAQTNLPSWVTGITDAAFLGGTLQQGDFFNKVAAFYTQARFGQYTSLYDTTQSFFFNVSRIIRDNASITYTSATTTNSKGSTCTTLWGNADSIASGTYSGCTSDIPSGTVNLWKNGGAGADPKDASNITGMATQLTNAAAGRANYSNFIGPGPVHTISTSTNFYLANQSGTTLKDWYNSFVSGTTPASVTCAPAASCQCGSGSDATSCAPSGSN